MQTQNILACSATLGEKSSRILSVTVVLILQNLSFSFNTIFQRFPKNKTWPLAAQFEIAAIDLQLHNNLCSKHLGFQEQGILQCEGINDGQK